MKELKRVKRFLAQYYEDEKAGIRFRLEPFERPRLNSPGKRFKSFRANPLRAYGKFEDALAYWTLHKERRKFLRAKTKITARDRAFSNSGEVSVIHSSDEFRLYVIRSARAANAYSLNTHWDQEESSEEPLNVIQIELPNGARYRMRMGDFTAQDELRQYMNVRVMLRDHPRLLDELVPVVRHILLQQKDPGLVVDHQWVFQALISCTPHGATFLPEGLLSRGFVNYFSRKSEQARNATPQDRKDRRGLHAHPFAQASEEVCLLVRSKTERAKVPASVISGIIEDACLDLSVGEAQKIWAIAATVPEWREGIQAENVMPVFHALGRGNYRGGYLAERALAQSFCLAAKFKDWRNGEEAQYLPQAIDYLLKKRDWPKLKTILVCACLKDNKAWREAIDRDTRNRITTYRFHNEYCRHHIDILMARLDAMDAGTYIPLSLKQASENERRQPSLYEREQLAMGRNDAKKQAYRYQRRSAALRAAAVA